jgi:hypothetical protein
MHFGGCQVIKGAQEELRRAAEELMAIRYRLLGVQASIPPSPSERSTEDLHEGAADVATELRSVIGVAIHDSLEPLIQNLLAAAGCRPERAADQEGSAEHAPPSIAHLETDAQAPPAGK